MAEKKEQTVFDVLNNLNVNEYTEKKDVGHGKSLTYLSWASAWGEVKKRYPDASYEIERFEGKPYFYDEKLGYMVFTTMTIDGITHEMWLPVMNGNNKAMKSAPYTIKTRFGEQVVDAATMFDVNTTIMRCLTKNMAMFGLGLYIYQGEDFPEVESKDGDASSTEEARKRPVDDLKIRALIKLAESKGFSEATVLAQYKKTHTKVASLNGMIFEDWEHLYKGYESLPDKPKEEPKAEANEQIELGV